MHSLIMRQIKRHLKGLDEIPAELMGFMRAVDEAYVQSDTDRIMLERSLAITSQELMARNRELNQEVLERKQAAEALERSQSFLQSTLDALSAHIAILDDAGAILATNAAWQRYSAVNPLVGGDLSQGTNYLDTCDALEGDYGKAARDLASGIREVMLNLSPTFDLEYACTGAAERQCFVAYVTRFERDGLVRIVVAHENVADLKHAQEALASSEEKLRHGLKLEALGRLAGGVAHDFNNLLTAISGYSELALDKVRAEDPLRGDLEEIRRACDRAAGLTGQLLAFGRRQVTKPRVLDLNAVVSDLGRMLQRLIGETIEFELKTEPELGMVMADSGQIEQILVNLAVNARDAMPAGGKLTITTDNSIYLEQSRDTSTIISAGRWVTITVRDSGQGMDDATRLRIFEPFFTTKELGKGTGLGLATVYGIVKQSGGHIVVDSAPGQGTAFTIFLPRVSAPKVTAPSGRLGATTSPGSETVLLVEDEASLRVLMRNVLTANGYHVIDAANGPEALRAAHAHPGPIQAMVTDVVMPRMSGRQLADELRRDMPEIKVLYVSGYNDDPVVHQAMLENGTAFLQKPFTPSVLTRKLREVLEATVTHAELEALAPA